MKHDCLGNYQNRWRVFNKIRNEDVLGTVDEGREILKKVLQSKRQTYWTHYGADGNDQQEYWGLFNGRHTKEGQGTKYKSIPCGEQLTSNLQIENQRKNIIIWKIMGTVRKLTSLYLGYFFLTKHSHRYIIIILNVYYIYTTISSNGKTYLL